MRPLMKFSVVFLALISVGILPLVTFGQGLVPCDGTRVNPCTFEMFITLIQNVLKYLIYTIATPIAAIMFAYAGYLYMTAGDEMGNIKKAHDIFVSVLWGFGVMLIAWALVWFIITFFTGDNSEYNLLQAPNAAAQAQP